MYYSDFDALLSHMAGIPHTVRRVKVCETCGQTAEQLAATGRVGCARCYQTFAGLLEPAIVRLHGRAAHTGRVPASMGSEVAQRRRLSELKDALRAAIEAEEFERAAQLRDDIRHTESEGGTHK